MSLSLSLSPVTLKLATSLDGRIATGTGESRWITGPEARAEVHRLRARHDAILIGIGTALADDPDLTVRSPAFAGVQPVRIVLDSQQRISRRSRLVETAGEVPTWIMTAREPDPELTAAGVVVCSCRVQADGQLDLAHVMEFIIKAGLHSVFVEGGGQVAASFLKAGLVDALEWFRAPVILGQEGMPAIGAMALANLADAPRLKRVSVSAVGDDVWERYERG